MKTKPFLRECLLVPVSSCFLSNLNYPFFIIDKSHKTLRLLSDITSLVPSTGINVLKIGQCLYQGKSTGSVSSINKSGS